MTKSRSASGISPSGEMNKPTTAVGLLASLDAGGSSPAPTSRPVLKNLPFFLFAIALFIIVQLNILLQQSMGGDGVLYASVAWNMAHDIGSLWAPVYLPGGVLSTFYEHPPLGMFVNSWFFRVFGDHFIVDRLYCLFTLILSFWAMLLIWYKTQAKAAPVLLWLPILCWVMEPLTTRTYPANAIEDLLTVFTTFGSLFVLQALATGHRGKSLVWFFLAAVCVTGAFFSNGLQAFFPLIIPFCYWLVFRNTSWQLMCGQVLVLIIFTALLIGAIFLYHPAWDFTHHYWNNQVWATLNGTRGGNGDFKGIGHLFGLLLIIGNALPLIFFTGIILFIKAKFSRQSFLSLVKNAAQEKKVIFFGLIVLVASLPILASSRQMAHYFLQAFPFVILLFLEILTPIFSQWTVQIKIASRTYKQSLLAAILFFCIAIAVTTHYYGKPWPVLVEVTEVSKVVPDNSTVSIAPSLANNWNLYAYFYRYHRIVLTPQAGQLFYLQKKIDTSSPADYRLIPLSSEEYTLWKKDSSLYHNISSFSK